MNAGYTDEAFELDLGPAVVAQIDALVAAAPPPNPRIVEGLRILLAPTVKRLRTEREAVPLAVPTAEAA